MCAFSVLRKEHCTQITTYSNSSHLVRIRRAREQPPKQEVTLWRYFLKSIARPWQITRLLQLLRKNVGSLTTGAYTAVELGQDVGTYILSKSVSRCGQLKLGTWETCRPDRETFIRLMHLDNDGKTQWLLYYLQHRQILSMSPFEWDFGCYLLVIVYVYENNISLLYV